MTSTAVRADFFDASALVKVFAEEPLSDVVRTYFHGRPTKYTTPFCFYEAMNALKGKWKYKGQLSADEYHEAAFQMTAWYGASSRHVEDLDFTDPQTFVRAKRISLNSGLDLSDAFQIVSVKFGYFSPLTDESKTVLVSADAALAAAARLEGLRVWNVLTEPQP